MLIGFGIAPATFAATPLFTTNCDTGCHGTSGVSGGRLNAAAAPGVITAANTNHSMGVGGLAGSFAAIAAEIDSVISRTSSLSNVPYRTTGNAVSIPTIVLNDPFDPANAVITSLAQSSAPGNGTLSGSGTTSITYNHTAANCSADSFQVIGQGSANTAARTVSVTIAAPTVTANNITFAAINYSVAPQTLDVISQTSVSGAGSALLPGSTIALSGQTGVGTLTATAGGVTTFTYSATGTTYSPTVTVQYRVFGPCGTQSPTLRTATIPVNLPPPPSSSNNSTNAAFNTAQPVILPVTGVFSQVNVTSATNGTAPTPAAGATTVTFTPTSGFTGTGSFTYTVTGPGGTSGTFTATVPVLAPAPPTIANVIVNNVAFQTATPITLPIGGVFSQVNVVSGPTNGTAPTPAPNSKVITYTPNAGFIGNDSITYSATGPGGASVPATATISITVLAPPAPSSSNSSTNAAFNTPQPVVLPVTGIFTQVNVTGATNGTAPTPAPGAATVTFTPTTGFIGTGSFTYTVTGPGGTSGTFTATVPVLAPGAPTVANRTVNVGFNTATPIDLTSSITGFFNSVQVVGGSVTNGTTSVAGAVVTFTPTAGYNGPATFQYTATAPGGAVSAPGTVSITVATQPAVASPATITVALNSSATLNLLPFITGSSITGISIATAPAHGTATVNGTNVTYTPASNYFGTDTFTYLAIGNAGSSAPATVTVTITGRPDPTADPTVMGTINNQVATAQRFSRSQLSNYQQRMESLHRGGKAASDTATGANAQASERSAPVATNNPSTRASPFPDPASSGDLNRSANAQDSARSGPPLRMASLTPPTSAADPATGAFGSLPPGLLTSLMSVAANRSLNVAAASGGAGDTPAGAATGSTGFWLGGNARFGTRDSTGSMSGTSFRTDGVSAGVDRRFSDRLVLGAGLGFARDKADIGTDGTQSSATGTSAAFYGSYQPTPKTFVDGLLGYGTLSFDTDRFVAPFSAMAHSHRSGNQVFGSLAAGYEHRDNGLLLSPYGRLDFTADKLKQTSETGGGQFSLTYFDQTSHSLRSALGVRVESSHETAFGLATPRLRVEYQHGFEGSASAQLAYTDLINGTRYGVTTDPTSRNSITLGVGSDFTLRNGVKLGIDYQILRTSSQETSQAILFRVSKELDGKGSSASLLPSFESSSAPLGIRVDAGYTYDRNVTRGRDSNEKFADQSYSLDLSKGWIFPVTEHTRAVLALSGGAEKFHSYDGLSRLYGGALGEYQYRTSGDFGAPTFAVFMRLTGEAYQSDLRDGYRYSTGLSVRKPVTDHISLFGALAHNERSARSSVFTGRDN